MHTKFVVGVVAYFYKLYLILYGTVHKVRLFCFVGDSRRKSKVKVLFVQLILTLSR